MNQRNALTETTFYILLSVFRPLHGYGIMQNIKEITNGRVQIGSGTLYGALTLLIEKGFIKQYYDGDKKKYIITESGVSLVETEVIRLNELLKIGRKTLKEGVKYEKSF